MSFFFILEQQSFVTQLEFMTIDKDYKIELININQVS